MQFGDFVCPQCGHRRYMIVKERRLCLGSVRVTGAAPHDCLFFWTADEDQQYLTEGDRHDLAQAAAQ